LKNKQVQRGKWICHKKRRKETKKGTSRWGRSWGNTQKLTTGGGKDTGLQRKVSTKGGQPKVHYRRKTREKRKVEIEHYAEKEKRWAALGGKSQGGPCLRPKRGGL